ncbi:LysM peptidoglycan-binding domain-containing protein, partial [Salmonella enterica subsp. enterica serovar Typhimurium]|nr:LysM peptidoglycan-binding domain-containing protein [Salmonella enterica subsp. enterica serovar Typhimurium]
SGETLWQISNRYGTTVQAIISENRIQDPNMIYPGMQLTIPRTKPTIEVNAYTYQSNETTVDNFNEIGHLLTYFSPFAYMIKEDGTLQPMNDQVMVDAAKSKNIVPMLAITNFTSTQAGSNLAHVVLSNPDLREKVLTNALQVMDTKGY